MGSDSLALVVDRRQVVIPLTGEVDDLNWRILLALEVCTALLEEGGRTEKELVDSCGTLTPSHDK